MKIVGIILIVLGSLNLIASMMGLSANPDLADRLGRQVIMAIGFIGLGIYLISRANDNQKKLEEKEKWNKGSDS